MSEFKDSVSQSKRLKDRTDTFFSPFFQEYDLSGSPLATPSLATLSTEYIRGEGMGGGVGGMVYSIKHPAPSSQNQEPSIICSHANHRGDVIARSDEDGSLTSFALYEAYGKRPYEWGTDPDRQKANTKEEEKDLGLLNEGMRYRDLETGTFLTRDPIGYSDGPNIYCYVHCNPIAKFDPLGLTPIPFVNAMLNNAASRIDNMSMPRSMYMAAGLVSEGLRGAAYNGSFTQAKDTYNSSVDRMTTLAENAIDSGANPLQVTAAVYTLGLGEIVGVTQFTQGVTKRDIVTGETLSNGEALQQTVQGTCQMILTGAALKSGYQSSPKPTATPPGETPSLTSSAKETAGNANKTIVIGENMSERVGPYANKIGAEVYDGMPGFKPGMEAEGLLHNQSVIEQKMAEGYKIIDIGPDLEKRAVRGGPSPNYQMERTVTKGYEGYQKEFIRTGKDSLILSEP